MNNVQELLILEQGPAMKYKYCLMPKIMDNLCDCEEFHWLVPEELFQIELEDIKCNFWILELFNAPWT